MSLDIEGTIFWTIAGVAFAVHILGPLDDPRASYRQQILVSALDKFILMTLPPGKGPALIFSPIGIGKHSPHSTADLVPGGTDAPGKRFQIHTTGGFLLGGLAG